MKAKSCYYEKQLQTANREIHRKYVRSVIKILRWPLDCQPQKRAHSLYFNLKYVLTIIALWILTTCADRDSIKIITMIKKLVPPETCDYNWYAADTDS